MAGPSGYFRQRPATGDGDPGARTVFGRGQRAMLLAAFMLLVALRLPQTWVHGRFLDEEATVFLAYAWHRPWLDALFRPFVGYWNFAADATTLAVATLVRGGVVPLERAAYLTMATALAVQLLPAVLILTGRAAWLAARPAMIAALLLIAIAPSTEEVFLNVLHIQFHLALCVALILALDVPRRGPATIGYGAMLFVAPLCGLGAIVMLPLVALRALVDRDVGRLAQAAVLAAGAAIQLLLFYAPNPLRGGGLDPGTVAATMFVRMIALPALGFRNATGVGTAIYGSQVTGGHGWWWCAAAAVLLFGLLVVQAARRRDAVIWLVLSGLSIAIVSFAFGMIVVDRSAPFDLAAERYDYLPEVLIGLSLVGLAMRPGFAGRTVYAALCGLMLFTGVAHYREPLPDLAQGPSWPAEVAAWRRDHRHPLAIWPRPYVADLSDRSHACSPVVRGAAPSADPRYCESGWVSGFRRQ